VVLEAQTMAGEVTATGAACLPKMSPRLCGWAGGAVGGWDRDCGPCYRLRLPKNTLSCPFAREVRRLIGERPEGWIRKHYLSIFHVSGLVP
jgi:hypothetical protein